MKFLNFSSDSQGQFQQKMAQSILGWWGFKFVQIKGNTLLQGQIITKLQKFIDEI